MSIDAPLESATLKQLQQTPIDNVLHIIDEGLVHLPTYRELFYRWERQQWRAQDIDFSGDRRQWEGMSQDERDMRMYGLSAFFQGEACVTDTLGPYIIAMPDEEMRIFITTQLADEARHTVFFARFFKEVLGVDKEKLEDALAVARGYMNEHLKYILIDALSEVAERIQREPGNLAPGQGYNTLPCSCRGNDGTRRATQHSGILPIERSFPCISRWLHRCGARRIAACCLRCKVLTRNDPEGCKQCQNCA